MLLNISVYDIHKIITTYLHNNVANNIVADMRLWHSVQINLLRIAKFEWENIHV